jgi:hypothetical protein
MAATRRCDLEPHARVLLNLLARFVTIVRYYHLALWQVQLNAAQRGGQVTITQESLHHYADSVKLPCWQAKAQLLLGAVSQS